MVSKKSSQLFFRYFADWINVYKVNAVREVTLNKYYMSLQWLRKLAPKLKVSELNRRTYQQLINDYAIEHEKQTTMDFHHQIKSAILDALDEGIIKQNPTRKITIKGKTPRKKKVKYLSQTDLQLLLRQLQLGKELNWDWFILLIAKTGIRFAEGLALTPNDFDFGTQMLTINKTWNYRTAEGKFQPTKNISSIRKIQLDWQTAMQFSQMIKNHNGQQLIFVNGRFFNSTINHLLEILCKQTHIPVISIHGLRHTHASLLLFAGVSIATVAQRLGHSSMTTTQETYLHIITELEAQDSQKIMQQMATLI
ncbi:site-specific integrase [Liquorilactobacillus oeni]|uniref:Integrase n=1 Tax=Liquorilactobacillus oeni DSM 19972 TaxID=1423777 RepID=A0A0R1MJD0_9LACO|nr:site-specific integrase [Liquorilactobacillus oeni]KRL05378.1 integrase [Liquorilactobacillus oeni DSM 19972]